MGCIISLCHDRVWDRSVRADVVTLSYLRTCLQHRTSLPQLIWYSTQGSTSCLPFPALLWLNCIGQPTHRGVHCVSNATSPPSCHLTLRKSQAVTRQNTSRWKCNATLFRKKSSAKGIQCQWREELQVVHSIFVTIEEVLEPVLKRRASGHTFQICHHRRGFEPVLIWQLLSSLMRRE